MMKNTQKNPRSDKLVNLRLFFAEGGMCEYLGDIFQVNLIIDANVLISDFLWLCKKRSNPDASTSLMEVLKAKTVRAFAPTFLLDEMEKKIPEISIKEDVIQNELQKHWDVYKPLIEFVDVGGVPTDSTEYRDPKDVPYLRLQDKIDAAILTSDTDIKYMGGSVTSLTLLAKLKIYSREAAIEYTLKFQGHAAIVISASLIKAGIQLLKSIFPSLRRIPGWFWLASFILILGILYFPSSRKWLNERIQTYTKNTKELGELFINLVNPMIKEHEKAKNAARKALNGVNSEIIVQ